MSTIREREVCVDNVITKGIIRDIRAYDGSLSDALTDIGSTECTLLIAEPIQVTGDLTVPENVTLKVLKGCPISIAAGVILTVNGPFEAGLYQVFSGDGSVSFGSSPVAEVYPEWWGAKGDGNTDDTEAFNKAFNASNVERILLVTQTYLIKDEIKIAAVIGNCTKVYNFILVDNGRITIQKTSGGYDIETVPFDYIRIDATGTNAQNLVTVSRNHVSSKGLRILGKIDKGQRGIYFTNPSSSINFVSFGDFDISGVDCPIWIGNLSSFNWSTIGNRTSYIRNFKSAITINAGSVSHNKFTAYLEVGDVAVEFLTASYNMNVFDLVPDNVTHLIKPHVNIGRGNVYILPNYQNYSVDTSAGGLSHYDTVLCFNDLTYNNGGVLALGFKNAPLIRPVYPSAYGLLGDVDNYVGVWITGKDWTGTPTDWKGPGKVGIRYYGSIVFYNTNIDQKILESRYNGVTQIRCYAGMAVNTIPDGFTTPPVSGGNVFKTDNSSATSIIDFSDATVGQKITVIFGDSNTTIVHGSGIILRGGTSVTPSADSVMEFVYDGTNWYEVSRNF